MPRYILRSGLPSPRHGKLVKKLLQEFTSPGTRLQPLILEEHLPSTKSRHVHVIWEAWKELTDEQRAAVILDAYTQAEGAEAAAEVTLVEGVTPQEAFALGLFPFKVVPIRRKGKDFSPDDYREVLAAEARNTLLGAKARGLRYARLEDAEAAARRLQQALPGSSWSVVQEVVQES